MIMCGMKTCPPAHGGLKAISSPTRSGGCGVSSCVGSTWAPEVPLPSSSSIKVSFRKLRFLTIWMKKKILLSCSGFAASAGLTGKANKTLHCSAPASRRSPGLVHCPSRNAIGTLGSKAFTVVSKPCGGRVSVRTITPQGPAGAALFPRNENFSKYKLNIVHMSWSSVITTSTKGALRTFTTSAFCCMNDISSSVAISLSNS
mmetsp:Transcript_105240/g.183062  ORF Transcript_105240/g.183062 Transcript_105240/m.183062 type:complete len:202 (+) Transcript_105240:553-1158(+)